MGLLDDRSAATPARRYCYPECANLANDWCADCWRDAAPDPSAASPLFEEVAFAIGALRSNQDLLLHKVQRTLSVKEQLATNRDAILRLQEALKRV